MSKERELLKRVLDEEDDGISFELSIEIKELLAQPEQEDKTTYIGETQWMQVPEPLGEEAICEILLKKEWKGFVELVRQIEKQHNIGE